MLSRILARLDRVALGMTAEKKSLTTWVTGLPVIQVTTYGRISGKPRICPLIPISDRDNLVVFATNFGAHRHPSWYHNMAANPDVLVSINGSSGEYSARDADEAERVRYWRQAIVMYPGFRSYASRADGRKIPIVVLSPAKSE